MLFIDPTYQHQWTALLKLAISKWSINEADVNEDNESAHVFYLDFGFIDIIRRKRMTKGIPTPSSVCA